MSTIENGWLTKSPPSKGLFRPRWRRRWFELKTGSFPNQFVLEYFTDESCRRQKGQINLDECEQLDMNHQQIAGPLTIQDRHKFTFNLRTPTRNYYLAADSEAEMNKWVTCLCHVCGLKTVDEDQEMYSKPPGDENNQPEDTENHESDESSPSLSNHTSSSGPYIPISECFTGKPMHRFVFPPEVNWATHPSTRKDGSDSDSIASHACVTPQQLNTSAPPRPPKKFSPSVITTPGTTAATTTTTTTAAATTNSPRPYNEMSKTLSLPSSTRPTVFPYDNAEEGHDSSSTCSSLHSPPPSAGALYSNIAEISPVYQNPLNMSGTTPNNNPMAQLNPIPSPGDHHNQQSNVPSVPSPPKVDRNLKPDLRKPIESPSYKSNHHQHHNHHHHSQQQSSSPTNKFGNKHSSGAMTLPNRPLNSSSSSSTGPIIDRFRKPDSHITLGPTPVQIKAGNNNNSNIHNNNNSISSSRYGSAASTNTNNTSTLPSSRTRRFGPVISPHDKKPPVYPYETPELTYLQIDCKPDGESKSKGSVHKLKSHNHQAGSHNNEDGGSVEYRLIDHVKTMALNQMLHDREEQLRTNHKKT